MKKRVQRLADGMESGGLVEFAENPGDARAMHLLLTEASRATYHNALEREWQWTNAIAEDYVSKKAINLMPHPTPAEQFDPSNPRFTADRFTLLTQMREEAPVTFLPALDVYAVTRWQEVHDVLGDAVTFASSEAFSAGVHLAPEALAIYSVTSPIFAYNPINVDKPLHTRLRDPLMAAFSPKRTQSLAPTVIADVEDLLDSIAASGSQTDLLLTLCKPLPLRTICRLLGVPLADAEKLSGWSNALVTFQTPGLPIEVQVVAAQGLRALENYIREMVAQKAATPDDGLISALVAGRAAGENDLSEDELVADIAIVFFAGHETTINTIANAFHSLLNQRDQWEAVVSGTVDTENLIDELLRHDTSVMGLYRRATVDTVIGGVPVPQGATLWVCYAAANRDPAQFDAPETLQCQRGKARQHLTFSYGAHYCVGSLLARLQLREAVTRAAKRFPEMHLAPGVVVPEIPNHATRGPITLPVLLK
ncbi:cytochrome P450 [Nostoc sp. WHI]|uniref:cytochrome P450 n=1 Tax=Nostoc sp. WHI TaxID=2650611 RepID=UPI0018C70EBD|nr:cytochrome P450 [Nostoc sp. WHI]MBG1268659.1 cytochrome P450 [Nostoc sp. WHI]